MWFTVDQRDCVGELKRDGVGGKAPERQVCVGDHTKGRGERRRCQVVANLTVYMSVSSFQPLGKREGRVCGIKLQHHQRTAALIKMEGNQLRGTFE